MTTTIRVVAAMTVLSTACSDGSDAPSTPDANTATNAGLTTSGGMPGALTASTGSGGTASSSDGAQTTTSSTLTTGSANTGATSSSNSSVGSGGGTNNVVTSGGMLPEVDCSPIQNQPQWELCDSGPDFCAAVFNDAAGCAAVCAAVGLECAEVWENAEAGCGPDTGLPQLSCSEAADHQSDYCLCRGAAATTGAGGASTSSTSTTASTTGAGGSGGTGGSGGGESSCSDVTGDAGIINATIVVGAGQVFDGECKRYTAGSALGDGSQNEDQKPVFRLENGARLVNVVLGSPAADGIHVYGNATLANIVWEDIGEDALTIKESGTVELDGGAAYNGEDKVFQINAASTFRVSNFTARSAGKFIRQNGGTTFKVEVFIDACDISNMDESIFRTDSSSSTVTMTNTRYSNIGDELFMGVNPGNITQSNNTQY